MPQWLQDLLDKATPISSTAGGLVALAEAVAQEVAGADDPVKKAAEVAKDIADYAEQVDAAIHANTTPAA